VGPAAADAAADFFLEACMLRFRFRSSLSVLALVAAFSLPALAQKVVSTKTGGGGSPHETVEWTLDGAKITIVYGKPFLKNREIGKVVAPYGQVWRTGADEATILTTDKALMIGGTMLQPGSYSLYTMPNAGAWKLIINKKTGQWGIPYPKETEAQEIARVDLKESKAPKPAENFTISIEDTPAGGNLNLDWGTMRQTVALMVH
jgi:Protein of unknown function (DUF2911)